MKMRILYCQSIKADGKTLKTISIETISVETHTGKLIRIPLQDLSYDENTEYFVEIGATTKTDWGILPLGFEVAHEQIPLTHKFKKVKTDIALNSKLSVKNSNGIKATP